MVCSIDEPFEIRLPDRRICGTLHIPDDGGKNAPYPLGVMTHGFGGCYNPHDQLAHSLAQEGMMVCGFDFCGGGPMSKSSGSMLDMSVLTETDDLNAVLSRLLERRDVDADRVCLFGRSQGGFVSAYVAAQRPQQVAALVMYFPAFVLQDDARKRADAKGRFPKTSVIAGHIVGRKYNEDAVSFDIYEVIGAFRGKVLIVHGEADRLVPIA